jgi:hypothetical protein
MQPVQRNSYQICMYDYVASLTIQNVGNPYLYTLHFVSTIILYNARNIFTTWVAKGGECWVGLVISDTYVS